MKAMFLFVPDVHRYKHDSTSRFVWNLVRNPEDQFSRIAAQIKLCLFTGNQRISDLSLKVIGMQCPNLEHLYVADCQRLTDASLKSLNMCRNLVVANFADCVRISDKGVRQLVEGPAGIRLRELNLTNCIRVGDIAMVNIHKR